jgi:choline dehydrogenase-like flavoprotein
VSLRDYAETGDDSDRKNKRKSKADYLRMLGSIAANAPSVGQYLYHRIFDSSAVKISTVHVRNFMEMAPDPKNRVTLSEKRDAYGIRVPFVEHRPGELDCRSVVAVHQALMRETKRMGWGTFVSDLSSDREPWPIDLDASHHMGATRMGNDPATSVVNGDCRLHFSPNVYVAGASVLPTSGNANPTFTLVALAIRLARHLSSNHPERLNVTT